MSRILATLCVLFVWMGVAAADDPATVVTGRVIDVVGRPIKNARVYVLPRMGEPHQGKTDSNGRYSIDVPTSGTHGIVIAIDKAHTFRTMIVKQGVTNTLDIELELDSEGGEVIKIEDRKRPEPAKKAEPKSDVRLSLPYSEEAVERDAWARAWFLLDVDEQGKVTRFKMLKKPGFDLDRIAIEEAFKLEFEPAKDAQGRPMRTYMLWTMEWPSMGWIVQGNGTSVRRPADSEMHVQAQNIRSGVTGSSDRAPIGGNWSRPLASAVAFPHSLDRVPCAGSGPLNLDLRNRAYRDCSQPDMAAADALPWITRDTAETAIAELERPNLELREDTGPPPSKVPQLVSTAITGGLMIGLLASYLKFNKYSDAVHDHAWQLTVDPDAYREHTRARDKWAKISLVMTGAVVISSGVTLFMWNRNQSKRSFSVQPTGSGGASASFGMSF